MDLRDVYIYTSTCLIWYMKFKPLLDDKSVAVQLHRSSRCHQCMYLHHLYEQWSWSDAPVTPNHWIIICGTSWKAIWLSGHPFTIPMHETIGYRREKLNCQEPCKWNVNAVCTQYLNVYRSRIRQKITQLHEEIDQTFVPGQAPSQLEFLLVVTVVIAAVLNPCMWSYSV